MRIKDLKFRTRLWIIVGVLLAGIIAVAAIASLRLMQLRGEWEQFQAITLAKQRAASFGYIKLGEATQAFNHYLLRGEEHAKAFSESLDRVDAELAAYRKAGALSPSEDEILVDIQKGSAAYRAGMAKAAALRADGVMTAAIDREIRGLDVPLAQGLENLLWSAAEAAKEKGEIISGLVQSTLVALVAIALGVTLIGSVVAWLLVRSVTTPLGHAVRLARAVAAGDLDQEIRVRSRDETGQLLQALSEMTGKLRTLMTEIRDVSQSVAGAADEIASGNADLSQRTEDQAASLEETASTMEELTVTVKHNADNARQANELAATATAVAQRGGQAWETGRPDDGRDQHLVASHRRHHRRDRRHRLPDQHPGAERRGRGGARRRAGPRLCGGRRRGAQPGAAQRHGGEGDQDPDRRIGGQGRGRAPSWCQTPAAPWTRSWPASSRWRDLVTEIAGASREQSAGIEQVTRR